MLDHVGVAVADLAKSKSFYDEALRPLAIAVVMEVAAEQTGADAHAGYGEAGKPFFWIGVCHRAE
jgi:catechol 2,3-dioxygenase-like lactoylglutathione lyase family enzyme